MLFLLKLEVDIRDSLCNIVFSNKKEEGGDFRGLNHLLLGNCDISLPMGGGE